MPAKEYTETFQYEATWTATSDGEEQTAVSTYGFIMYGAAGSCTVTETVTATLNGSPATQTLSLPVTFGAGNGIESVTAVGLASPDVAPPSPSTTSTEDPVSTIPATSTKSSSQPASTEDPVSTTPATSTTSSNQPASTIATTSDTDIHTPTAISTSIFSLISPSHLTTLTGSSNTYTSTQFTVPTSISSTPGASSPGASSMTRTSSTSSNIHFPSPAANSVAPQPSPSPRSMSSGEKAGIAVGVLAAAGILAGLVWFVLRKRRRTGNRQSPGGEKPGDDQPVFLSGGSHDVKGVERELMCDR